MRKFRKNKKNINKLQNEIEIDEELEDLFEAEDIGDGDEFMSVLPWKGAICEPSISKFPLSKPD